MYQNGAEVRTERLRRVTAWSDGAPDGFLRFSMGDSDEFLVAAGTVLTIRTYVEQEEEDPLPGSGCPTCGG